jgi:hypothetical protein
LLSAAQRDTLIAWTHPSAIAVVLTIVLLLLSVAVLASQRSRWIVLSVATTWMALVWATVHAPSAFHASFLFLAYAIALMADSPKDGERSWLPARYAGPVLAVLLGMQLPITFHYALMDVLKPFSGGQPTAEWLMRSGLSGRPMVIEPDTAAPTILAYTGVRSAYLPACQCRGSFVVFRRSREENREVTVAELQAVKNGAGGSPLLVSHVQLFRENLQKFGMTQLYESPHGAFWPYEDLYVYGESSGPQASVTRGEK